MHRRLLLTLRYDGTRYCGWQVQKNAVSVQQTVQDAIERVTGVRAGLTGCSRTDAGVHADMYCCAFDTESRLPEDKMVLALNAWLPADVAVYGCRQVPADFHPRYDALGKRYIYRVWNAAARNPFWEGRALHRRGRLDEAVLDQAAAAFIGRHDYAGFCAAGSAVEDTVRTVRRAQVAREGDMVLFTVEADGFLYHMVRIMAGTLLDIAAGRMAAEELPAVLASCDRGRVGFTAPACGLWLDRVFYPTEYGIS